MVLKVLTEANRSSREICPTFDASDGNRSDCGAGDSVVITTILFALSRHSIRKYLIVQFIHSFVRSFIHTKQWMSEWTSECCTEYVTDWLTDRQTAMMFYHLLYILIFLSTLMEVCAVQESNCRPRRARDDLSVPRNRKYYFPQIYEGGPKISRCHTDKWLLYSETRKYFCETCGVR